jgi:DNA primase
MSDRENIEEIKSRLDIVPIVEKQVKLRKAGKNFLGLCPFHSEKTPSFIVSPSIQRYKCFGCGESGDIFNFVEKTEHLDFVDVLEKLAKEAGVELKKTSSFNQAYAKIFEINSIAAEFYAQELSKNISAKNYIFNKRKFDEKTVKEFKIGYAVGGTRLLQHIKTKGSFSKTELLSSGLFSEKEDGIKDRFFKRIMFPIHDTQGKVAGFTGRILEDSKYGPKYLHTPETALFKKSFLLYGLFQAKAHIRESDLCIICEGTTDVISAHQKGVKNIVAPLGTAIAEEQLKLMTRFTKNILLLMDNDEAGQNALERYFTLGIGLDLNLYTNSLAPYEDLDELMQKESEKIKDIVKNRKDLFSHLIFRKLENKDINNYKDYKEIISYVSYLLSNVHDEKSREFFLNQAEKITTIKRDFFSKEEKNFEKPQDENKVQKPEKLEKEAFFLSLVLHFEEIAMLEKIDLRYFLNKEIKHILEHVQSMEKLEEKVLLKTFANNEILNQCIFESSRLEIDLSKKDKYLLNTYEIIRRGNIEKIIKQLRLKETIAIQERNRKKAEQIEHEIIRLKKLQTEK